MPRPPSPSPKVRVNISMPPDLYADIQHLCERESRSFSAQVVVLLEAAVQEIADRTVTSIRLEQRSTLTNLPVEPRPLSSFE